MEEELNRGVVDDKFSKEDSGRVVDLVIKFGEGDIKLKVDNLKSKLSPEALIDFLNCKEEQQKEMAVLHSLSDEDLANLYKYSKEGTKNIPGSHRLNENLHTLSLLTGDERYSKLRDDEESFVLFR